MISLTVRTLDSQNHAFTVEDDITVEQFKAHIADKVNIPVETQRIIYCGRVLQNTSKLNDYDVNGKVVHLVQRAPPSSTSNSSSSNSSPQTARARVLRGREGNAMYLGSMAFPSNLMESQGIIPPPPTHSLAGSRLNVARRMLRRAEQVINLLENPSAPPAEQSPPEEAQDEVTPVIEARVIVPSSNSIDEAMVFSAVQNSLFNGATGPIQIGAISIPTNIDMTGSSSSAPNEGTSSSPEGGSSLGGSTENLAPEQNTNRERGEGSASGASTPRNADGLVENASRTSEMADLLTMLSTLQARFEPFLTRYRNFMQDDPIVCRRTDARHETQVTLDRVSSVLHYLGHAYHSLSDIIIRVRTPPPRPLLCRPILIQHSAVVQAGIPIQVEAQINLTSDGAPPSSTATNATPTTNTNPTRTQPQVIGINGMPFLPMRMQSFPFDIRNIATAMPSTASPAQPNNNNNATTGAPPNVAAASATTAPPTSTADQNSSATAQQPEQGSGGAPQPPSSAGGAFSLNNPNVEFSMEITPEVLQALQGEPPPELLQSIMQMAGQMLTRGPGGGITMQQQQQPPTTDAATSEDASSTTGSNTAPGAVPGQNSQARGNTQTHPTTSTHTRSTARPHVHLHQQAMQGGFDPFLPCNSHHVTRCRRAHARAMASNANAATNQSQAAGGTPRAQGQAQDQANPLYNIMNEIMNTVRTAYTRMGTAQAATNTESGGTRPATGGATAASGNAENAGAATATLPPGASFNFLNFPGFRSDPTIAQLLQQLPPDEPYVFGESIITDLIMMLSRNMTITDVVTLNRGFLEPLNRMGEEIQTFFLSRVLHDSTTDEAIDSAVDRIIEEIRPFLETLGHMQVRGNIDIVRSAEVLFRARLPPIIRIATNLQNESSFSSLVEQLTATANELCTLAMRASANGLQGVEQVFELFVSRYMQGIPNGLQEWTLITSRGHLRQFMSNLTVPFTTIQPYIVRKRTESTSTTPVVEPSHNRETVQPKEETPERMDCDEQEASGSGGEEGDSTPPLKLEETEALPNLVIGSENWHNQVPTEWVPIIARDAQRQRRQNSQPPFSDAYLSGMPSKRRKVVRSKKPQGSVSQIITDSVRRAITATGLTSVAPPETVAQAAGSSEEVQSAYTTLLRTNVQDHIRDNESFTPERFPNATNFFKQ